MVKSQNYNRLLDTRKRVTGSSYSSFIQSISKPSDVVKSRISFSDRNNGLAFNDQPSSLTCNGQAYNDDFQRGYDQWYQSQNTEQSITKPKVSELNNQDNDLFNFSIKIS